ncbi:MAG: type IV pilus modification PilV family protein [Planctomycetota bacterium]|jgi:hypothetical protein
MATKATQSTQSGFTMVELMGALVVCVLLLMSMQSTLFSATKIRSSNEIQAIRCDQAYDYVQRLKLIPFGTSSDPAASPSQLTELFDDDQDLGTVTLRQVSTAPGSPGHTFTTMMDDVTTTWRVRITSDLDRDGAINSFREGRTDLLLVEVYAENQLMFRTMRAADFANTQKD